jgi:hypothetical protein
VVATGATSLPPQNVVTQAVLNRSVMRAPLSNIYPAMMAQREADNRGSAWQVSRAQQDSARAFRRVSLPFTVGI